MPPNPEIDGQPVIRFQDDSPRLRTPLLPNFPPRHPLRAPHGQVLSLCNQTLTNLAHITTTTTVTKSTSRRMKRLLILALTAATLLSANTPANAHCDSRHGHQDTTTHQEVKK